MVSIRSIDKGQKKRTATFCDHPDCLNGRSEPNESVPYGAALAAGGGLCEMSTHLPTSSETRAVDRAIMRIHRKAYENRLQMPPVVARARFFKRL
jgi:hypothetical protein